jgi:monoamine oxidase
MEVDVVVVGAGISGLIAARNLKDAGLSVIVLEKADRIGGRLMRTRAGAGNTTAWVDLGGQWAGGTQLRVMALAKELGVKVRGWWLGARGQFLGG